MTPIRVLLADDHESVRQGLKLLIDAQPDMTIVGQAATGRIAVESAPQASPHVIVMDVAMPDLNGLAAARELKRAWPDIAVVAWTRHDDEAFSERETEALRMWRLVTATRRSPTRCRSASEP